MVTLMKCSFDRDVEGVGGGVSIIIIRGDRESRAQGASSSSIPYVHRPIAIIVPGALQHLPLKNDG